MEGAPVYQRILLAYDGTREGLVALREGALLAKLCGAQVFLLSILSTVDMGVVVGDGVYGSTADQDIETHKSVLARGVAVAKQLGLDPVAKLVVGEPVSQIGAYAKEIDADLVVLGHRRKNLLERWWSGATGAFVTDSVHCSVLIGRNAIADEAFNAEVERSQAAAAKAKPAS
jgi:nucleotide-binding universal stress UspA family protein